MTYGVTAANWAERDVIAIAVERFGPLVGALIGACFWASIGKPFPQTTDSLFGTAATVASVFASFLGVSETIILTVKDTEVYRALSSKGYTSLLFRFLKSGIIGASLFAGLSLLGFFFDASSSLYGHKIFGTFKFFWVFSGLYGFLSYARITNILFKLLRQT